MLFRSQPDFRRRGTRHRWQQREATFVISESFKIQYRWIRICLDLTYVVAGYLLGGVFGLGTIVATLLLGPTIQFFLPIVERPVKKFLGTSTAIV